jgi:hypothetical protein
MTKLSLASVTLEDLAPLVRLESREPPTDLWDVTTDAIEPSLQEHLRYLTNKLRVARPTTLNEATVWSRAIYPLLELAETDRVRAWAEVLLGTRDPFSGTEIAGVIDGVLAPEGLLAGAPDLPFLLVVEAKRGMEALDPRPQLIAALVAVLWAELGRRGGEHAETFGCFTVGDIWTFAHATATALPVGSSPRLAVSLAWSREYAERSEAETIFRLLCRVVRKGDAR